VAARTFAWLGRDRRHSEDQERLRAANAAGAESGMGEPKAVCSRTANRAIMEVEGYG